MSSTSCASSLREAAPYFRQLANSKIALVLTAEQLRQSPLLLQDLALLRSQGARLVVVLDCQIELDAQAGRQLFTRQNKRPISAPELAAAKALIDANLGELISGLQRALAQARIHRESAWLLGSLAYARNHGVIDGVDLQAYGQVRNVNARLFEALGEHILLLSQFLPSQSGEYYLVDRVDLIHSLARSVQFDKLILCGSVPQAMSGSAWQPQQCRELLTELEDDRSRAQLSLLADICARGYSKRGYLIDPLVEDSMLDELFSASGTGIMVTAEHYERIAGARSSDINAILQLTEPMVQSGKLRPRDAALLEREIDNFVIARHDHEAVGCAALRPWQHQAGWSEVECLAVAEKMRGHGLGARLLELLEQRARKQGQQCLVLLTTQSMGWFAERGFTAIDSQSIDLDRVDQRCRSAQVMVKQLT